MVKYILAGALLLAQSGSAAPQGSLAGVWRTVEARDAGGRDITDRNARNMFMFSRNHFTVVWSELNRPRFTGELSDSQKVAMWQDFGAQAGRYEFARDTLVLYSEIAKSPGAMVAGTFQKYSISQVGNDIWLQLLADNNSPLPNQERVRLVRLE